MPQGAETDVWPEGRKCAISFTYDGALPEHRTTVAPLLESLGLRATFFVSPTLMLDEPNEWKRIAESHEIGSHCLFGVTQGGTLLNWTLSMVEADMKSANQLIAHITGVDCRSFALPGWSTACAEGDYLPVIQRMAPYVRSERREQNDWKTCDFGYLGSHPLEQIDPASLVSHARKNGSWLVFRIASLEDAPKHERTLKSFAAAQDLWIAPFSQVAERLGALRAAQSLKS